MCSILVIDDEKKILSFVQEALTLFGHKVEVAEDGLKGIEKFDNGSFDIVITDMRMPRIDGREVVRHIRNSPKKSIPIVGISGTPWRRCLRRMVCHRSPRFRSLLRRFHPHS